MLTQMRHISQTWLIKLLLIFLVVSFAIWGIGDIFRGNQAERAIAHIGEIKLTAQMVEKSFQRNYQQIRQVAGPDFTAANARQAGLLDQTLQNLVEESLFNQETGRLGIHFNNETALQLVKQTPGLTDAKGNFNTRMFQSMLYDMRITEADYFDMVKKDASRRVLIEALRSGLQPPKTMSDALAASRSQERLVQTLVITHDSMSGIDTPDDTTLIKFHEVNAARFTAPEVRDVSVLKLLASDIASEISVSDTDLKKIYDENLAEYGTPERRSYLQVVVQDEAKAKQIAADASALKSLREAAAKNQEQLVTIEDTKPTDLLPELKDIALKTTENGITPPIKSTFGWHVMQVTKIKPGAQKSFAEVKDEIRANATRDQAIEQLQKVANQVDDSLAGGATFEEVAEQKKLKLMKIEQMQANGKTIKPLQAAQIDVDNVAKYAFALNEGEASSMLDDGKGNYYLVRTDKINASRLRLLADVRDEVVKAWQDNQRSERAQAKADEIAKAVRGGKALADFVGTGINLRDVKPISVISAQQSDMPKAFIPQIMALRKGDAGVAADPKNHYVMQLKELRDGSTPSGAAAKQLAEDITRGTTNDLFVQYSESLRTRFPVKVDEKALANLRAMDSQ
jgi:peptidyl-prolyl cis-trans isomerase D